MAKKIVTTTRQFDDDDEPQRDRERIQRDIDADPGEASYAEFVSKLGAAQGCKVRVHRLTPQGRKQYCFFDTPENVSEEAIRIFHSKQAYASEEGTYLLSVEVNGEPRPPFTIQIAPQCGVPGEPSALSGGMADVIRLLQQQNERLESRLMQQERAPMLEMIEGMQRLDQMRGGHQPQQLPIEAIMKAVEIGQKLNSPAADDWNSLLISTLKDNGPMLLGILGQLVKGRTAEGPGVTEVEKPEVLPPENPNPLETPASEPMPKSQPDDIEQMALKKAIEFLKKQAMKQSDPGLYVDLIVDNREDPLYARLIHKVATNDFSEFAAIDPDIKEPAYRDFFRFIYDGIRSTFVPAAPMVTSAGGKGGNKANPKNNGADGKAGGK